MWKRTKPVVLTSIAALFIIFGVLGLFLPFLQGILFILIGICILALVSPKFKASLYHKLTPYPKTKAKTEVIFARLEKFFGKKS